MKNITIIAIAIFCNILAHAQDFEPVQQKFYTFTDTTYTTIDSIYIDGSDARFRTDDKIIRGWHWSKERKLTEALLMNEGHPWMYSVGIDSYNPDNYADNTDLILNVPYMSANAVSPVLLQTVSMQWGTNFIYRS